MKMETKYNNRAVIFAMILILSFAVTAKSVNIYKNYNKQPKPIIKIVEVEKEVIKKVEKLIPIKEYIKIGSIGGGFTLIVSAIIIYIWKTII